MGLHSQKPVLQKLIDLASRLVEPARTVSDPERRRQARLLASILLFFLLISSALFIVRLPVVGLRLNAENASRVLLLLAIWPLSQLSRRGQVRLVSLVGVVVGTLILFALAATDELDRTNTVLAYLVVVLLFGSLFLSARLNILILVAQLAGLLAVSMSRALPTVSLPSMIAGPFSFHLTIGTLVILVAWHRDLLERSRLEQLAQSEQHLQDVIASNIDGMVVIDQAGLVRFLNPAAVELFDQPIAALLDRPFGLPLTDNPFTEITLALARGLCTIEMRLVPIQWNNAPALLASLRDVTARKRAEDALRESQSLYHSLVEGSPLSICRKDLAGRFTFANRRFLEESQRALADLVGKTDFDLHPPKLAEKYQRDDRAVMDSGQVWELIEERAVLGGETNIIQSIKTPIYDGAGQINGVQISFWDITARQRAEAALRELNATLEQRVTERTDELQAANLRLTELDHLKDEFLSRISHELRTPLSTIKLYLELLETGKPENHGKYLLTLKGETQRLHTLIEEVLLFSQLNLYTTPSALEPIDLNHLLENQWTIWQKLSAGHALQFKLELASALPPARTDSELIRQALTRLIMNAVNYTPAGSVTVSTALRDDNGQPWVTLSVQDTGPGITPDDLPHIFERFYRGRAAANYKTPGTGVGLSISREIAEKLGGHLTVETQVGIGSTFTLWLPAA